MLIDEYWSGLLRFSPDAAKQPQASAFRPLLNGSKAIVIQSAHKREIDIIFKYVGVAGVDKHRIVQVGVALQTCANRGAKVGWRMMAAVNMQLFLSYLFRFIRVSESPKRRTHSQVWGSITSECWWETAHFRVNALLMMRDLYFLPFRHHLGLATALDWNDQLAGLKR